jgi:hypothetical protein
MIRELAVNTLELKSRVPPSWTVTVAAAPLPILASARSVTVWPLAITTVSPKTGATPPTHVEPEFQAPDWALVFKAATSKTAAETGAAASDIRGRVAEAAVPILMITSVRAIKMLKRATEWARFLRFIFWGTPWEFERNTGDDRRLHASIAWWRIGSQNRIRAEVGQDINGGIIDGLG